MKQFTINGTYKDNQLVKVEDIQIEGIPAKFYSNRSYQIYSPGNFEIEFADKTIPFIQSFTWENEETLFTASKAFANTTFMRYPRKLYNVYLRWNGTGSVDITHIKLVSTYFKFGDTYDTNSTEFLLSEFGDRLYPNRVYELKLWLTQPSDFSFLRLGMDLTYY